ncbi:MAG: hypothetical protein M3308_10250 [Actinomycetota bacterium]|nr:hypothetical protein [Actinomycetota bacterium]
MSGTLAGLPGEDAELRRTLRDDSRRAERDARDLARAQALLDEPTGSASRSDELLAAGAAGLRFFDMFGPLYTRYTAAPFDAQRDIYVPYHRLAGMDFAALRRDFEVFQACGQSLSESTAVLRNSFEGLVSHWRGAAASNATGHVTGVLDIAGLLSEDISTVGRSCGRLADALEEAVRSYASAALSLYSPTCAMGSPALVERLIELATSQPEPGTAAQQILNEDFVPTFEERLRVFRKEVLARHEDGIRTTWMEFQNATSVEKIPENPFAGVSPAGSSAVWPAQVHSQPSGNRDHPAQPEPAQGETDADRRSELEAGTIWQGTSTSTVPSSDGMATVQISVDDGGGRPREHIINFGAPAPGARMAGAEGAEVDQPGVERALPAFELSGTTVTTERIDAGTGPLVAVNVDGETGAVSRYLVDVDPERGVIAHPVPGSDGAGAAFADGPVTTRAASIGLAGPSGQDPVGDAGIPGGGAVLGDAGPGGATLGSVSDGLRGGDGGTQPVRRELDGSGQYRERSGGGWRLPTELDHEQDAPERHHSTHSEQPPAC